MFSSTAYEAFYTIIGLHFHQASIEIITSQAILAGILALIFGASFFFGVWGFFKKYVPGFLGGGGGASSSIFIKLIASFLLGVSLLKMGSFQDVRNFKRVPWHENDYITTKFDDIQRSYKVSFVYDLMTTTADEVAGFFSKVVDRLFEKTNSEIHAPSAFYKAILYSGSVSIKGPKLRSLVSLYASQCFDNVIPQIEQAKREDLISEFFRPHGVIDNSLRSINLQTEDGETITCLDLKNEVNRELTNYAYKIDGKLSPYKDMLKLRLITESTNLHVSNLLTNFFREQSESKWLGIQKGSEVPGKYASFLLAKNRLFSWDGLLNLFGGEKLESAGLTADRAIQFSEYLKRAPHLKGMVKLFLIAIFPWLIFFIFAGKWKILISWWAVYFSVALWTPLWIGLHHLMTSIALSTEVMIEFGKLSNGVSLYSAELINGRLYQFYAIYSWLQMIIGPLPTVLLTWGMFTGFLKDSQQESAPLEGVGTVASVAGATLTGGASAGVGAGVKAGATTAAKSVGYHATTNPKNHR